MRRRALLAAAVMLAAPGGPATALTLLFEGPIASVQTSAPAITADLPVGEMVTVEIVYDPLGEESAATVDDPDLGHYRAFQEASVVFESSGRLWEAVAGANPAAGFGSQLIIVSNDQMFFQDDETFVSDTIQMGAVNSDFPDTSGMAEGEIGGLLLQSVVLVFQDRDPLPEVPDMLVDDTLPAAAFLPERIQVTFSAGDEAEESGVFFLEPVMAVPEPAPGLALAVGSAVLTLGAWVRRQKGRTRLRST